MCEQGFNGLNITRLKYERNEMVTGFRARAKMTSIISSEMVGCTDVNFKTIFNNKSY